ncbi:hypothetical protein, partial [Staphylococcus aureus]|uniref:hypothetical protein n=1 Tax=Staphylococcus aureus TaxID=1280 RepID=UPI0039BE39BD
MPTPMKKILIIKDYYGSSYYDASTQELEDEAVLDYFSRDEALIKDLQSVKMEDTFFVSEAGKVTKEQYENYKKILETLDPESPMYKFGDKIVRYYEHQSKNLMRYIQ